MWLSYIKHPNTKFKSIDLNDHSFFCFAIDEMKSAWDESIIVTLKKLIMTIVTLM
jgi:hypothetical protein